MVPPLMRVLMMFELLPPDPGIIRRRSAAGKPCRALRSAILAR
jgi:hypothetical protein